jgi:DNA replication protein DnaC
MELLREPISRYIAQVGDLRSCTFGNFHTQRDGRLVNVRNAVIRFVQVEVPWVYVYEPPHNGKNHLAAAAANTLVTRGRAVFFATAPELLAMIRDGFNAGQAEDLIGVCQCVPWLLVNDLGAERLTDWAGEASAQGLRLSSTEVLS